MRLIIMFAAMIATPALAHNASLPQVHSGGALPAGLVLIALAGTLAMMKSMAGRRR